MIATSWGWAGSNVCEGVWGENALQNLNVTVAHTASTATIEFSSTLNQDPSDESWGIRNVLVQAGGGSKFGIRKT